MKMIAFIDAGALIGLCAILGVLGALFVVIIVFAIVNHVRNQRVLASSPYISSILETNKNYHFECFFGSNEEVTFHLGSKRSFDNFSSLKKRDEVFKNRLNHFQSVVQKIDYNINTMAAYKRAIAEIPPTKDAAFAKKMGMSLQSYQSRELKLSQKFLLQATTDYKLTIRWEYISPAGRNHYSGHRVFPYADIKDGVARFAPAQKAPAQVASKDQPKPRTKTEASRPLVTNIEEIE